MSAVTAEMIERCAAAAPPVTDEVRARIAALMPPVAQLGHPPAGPRTQPPPKPRPSRPSTPPTPPTKPNPKPAKLGRAA